MKTLLLAFFVIILTMNTNQISAQQLKIGVVDVETIIKELPEAQKADKDLKDLGLKFQDTLMKMQQSLEERFQQYQKQKAMMPADQQQKTEQELQMQNQELLQYRELKFGQNGDLARRRVEFLEPLREKILKAISEVAKKENMNFVLEKGGQTVLYAEEKFDITFLVLDKIKRGN